MRARNLIALGTFVSMAISAPAWAQSKGGDYPVCPPNKKIEQAESDAAHTKYLSGKVDYDESKYDSAITNFKAAYEKDCTKHELLIIISRAYEFDHKLPEAIHALEVYLDRVPNASDAATHRTRIANLKQKLADQQKAAATPAPAPSGGTSGNATTQPSSEGSGHTIYPWILVGAGVVTTAVGVVLLLTTPSLPPGCNADTKECELLPNGEKKTDQSYIDRRDEAGRSVNQPIAGAIVTAAGGALIVGGLVWYFLEPTGPKESAKGNAPRVSPQIGQGYSGLALTGRF